MTDEQFKLLMDKLEELKTYRPNPYLPGTYPPPLQHSPQDYLPPHWIHQGARD